MIKYAIIDGVKYPINTNFKVAIECDKIMNDGQIDDYERGVLITGLLFGEDSPYTQEALDKARLYLTNGSDEKGEKRILDFRQHWDFYYGAFKAQYGIDLNKDELHYHEFVSLLKSLKGQALNDVVEILTYDLSEVKDTKQRRKIVEAQNKYKIKDTDNKRIESAFLNALSPKVKGG